jgi:hypothetical protein
MSCVLTIIGTNFDVDAFVEKAAMPEFDKSYKGEPINRASSRIAQYSSASMIISNAGFGNVKTQIEEATEFLIKHRDNLKHIATTKEIEFATIDFGVDSIIDEDHLTQGFYFTLSLIEICAELKISITLSTYKPDLELILERKRAEKLKG